MLTSTDKFTISPIYLGGQVQVRGDALRRFLMANGYSHIHIDDDDRFSAITPQGTTVHSEYVFMKKVLM